MSSLKACTPRIFAMLAAVFLAPFAVLFGLMMLGFVFGLVLIAVCHAALRGPLVKDQRRNAPLAV
ncbi:MAG: hypothetical protein GJ676_14070 [Rhodobacteraceae bacterium]|nr:hypothetical protein [Paracoccaceae bacterium]